MASTCQLCDCVAPWGEGSEKGKWPLLAFPLGESCPPALIWCQILHFLPVCHCCLSSCYPGAGPQREWVWVSLCVGSLGGTAWDSRSFFHILNSHWFLQPEVVGTYFSYIGTLGWGAWCGTGTPHSQDIPPQFLSTTHGCGTRPFHISTPPTSLNGCGFFNSVVIRLPFNSISDVPEWWWFYNLAVILMCLCKDPSHVYYTAILTRSRLVFS